MNTHSTRKNPSPKKQSPDFHFHLKKTRGKARAGQFVTPHGDVPTPIYMTVGTQATVKGLDSLDVESTQAPILLANTYHLYLRPGTALLNNFGGVHNFMRWQKPILTDSGGFQVFSLGKQLEKKNGEGSGSAVSLVKIKENGVEFRSHLDGSKHFFTPEKAIEIQRQIGADIIMAFDICTPDNATKKEAQTAWDQTWQWLQRCVTYWENNNRQSAYGKYQALFGIAQGALHKDIRRQAVEQIATLPVDGIALGGESVGYNMAATEDIVDWVRDILPKNKPRYAMGLGRDPQDIITAITCGIDMFDCVAPARLARNGALYYGKVSFPHRNSKNGVPKFASPFNNGRLQITNRQWEKDHEVIQPGCDCYTCRSGYSRAYLRHLYKTKELSYYRLASMHNIRFMIRLCEEMREWIIRSIKK